MKKITPCLWCDNNLEEMVDFSRAVFPDTEIVSTARSAGGPVAAGRVLSMTFRLMGQELMGINGGPYFSFTPAISFFVACQTQAEIDGYWEKLLADGGKPSRCGWLTDRFGVSWQIVPEILGVLNQDPDRAKAGRVTQAMLAMVKLDIAGLQHAYDTP